ncbi:MAG: Nramp family divalent metal transporter [Pirellulaceae bacterium]|nr:Nramp family divalent metal transporter [Pirellulaceae bacterium]
MHDTASTNQLAPEQPLPLPALLSRNPLRWLTIFGPGAIVASLTIGTGELIFSSRAGAIFGYRILFLFALITLAKWILLYSVARHMVASGVHPLRRWVNLPIGPRGWLPGLMFLLAAVCIPIWVSFHASVLGDWCADLTNTKRLLSGATVHIWGLVILCGVFLLALRGGYRALENIQLLVITIMLAAVVVSLVLLRPDWFELLTGFIIPRSLEFPQWLVDDSRPALQRIAAQPLWIEASLYVGVIGGAGYDYLAYTAFLREKGWGRAGGSELIDTPSVKAHTEAESQPAALAKGFDPSPATALGLDITPRDADPEPLTSQQIADLKLWMRAPLIDCTASFLTVLIFSTAFVASGHLILAPQHQIPGDGSFLGFQAQFLTRLSPGLYPLYVIGTFLTMFGTLYGTIEVAPAILRECYRLLLVKHQSISTAGLRQVGLAWTAAGAGAVLLLSFFIQWSGGPDRPPGLTGVLVPANLFTGVLSCGIICLLNPWIDRRLPTALAPGWWLVAMNLIAGCAFFALGIKGYWDYGGVAALWILVGTVLAGFGLAWALRNRL